MNPISSPPEGKERRKGERNRLIIFWCVIGICAVVATGAAYVAHQADLVAHKSEKAHCVLVKFLVGSNLRNRASINQEPPGTKQQQQAVKQTAVLIQELRDTGIKCVPIPAEVKAEAKERK